MILNIFARRKRSFSSLKFRQLILLCTLVVITFSSQAQAKQYGLLFEEYSYDGYASDEADQVFEEIAGTGVGWASIVVSYMADNINSTSVYRSSRYGITPSDDWLIHAIEEAHSQGLKVMLYPHLQLEDESRYWFGEIGKNFGAVQWDKWFASYTQFIAHYADLAAEHGVEQLSIGMELMYAEKQEAHWRELISVIRQRYSGTLVYAENYSTETNSSNTSNVRWWDALDYIGIDAYYDLIPEDNTNPTLEDMLQAWEPILARLESYSREWNKPILIPELGYRSSKGSVHHPWDDPAGNTVDLQEQANAYQAFYQSFVDKPWFAGVFWWSHTTSEPDSIENTSYSPIGKPAEEVIQQY